MIPGFKILRELGRGGMATVYLAVQESLNREVALKVLAPALATDAAFAERFVREARIAGGFRHRHLIAVVDAGQVGDELYLAMEYVPGGSAASLRGGDPNEIRRCILEVASALSYAHARGVIHRDLKPDNILRREDGSYVLSDFGIARSVAHGEHLTAPQAALGTPAYMSPEQWRNQPVDGRADLYALGIVCFELLTGRLPFADADSWSMGLMHIQGPRPRLPDALQDWQPVLDGLLATAPGDRFADANALIAALTGHSPPTPVVTPPQGAATVEVATPVAMRAPRRALPVRVGVGIAALAFALLLAWALLAGRPARVEAPSPAAPALPQNAKSVAVLPFRLLSDRTEEDGYFAAGLSEEILTTLAAIPELKVAGRTSSFAWKDKEVDVEEIGAALGVAHVLEGSVRRSGTQRRIRASLIDVADKSTRWSENFDSDDGDVLAIQTRIATAVADRLSVSMGTRALPTLARLPPGKRASLLEIIGRQTEAHDSATTSRVRDGLRAFIDSEDVGPDLLLRLIFVDAQLIRMRALPSEQGRIEQEEMARRISQRFGDTVERKIADALALQTEADLSHELKPYADALKLYREVSAEAPNDALVAINASHAARYLLEFDSAIGFARKAVLIEPDDQTARLALVSALGEAGQVDAAIAESKLMTDRVPGSPPVIYAFNLAGAGRFADALNVLGNCDGPSFQDFCRAAEYQWLKLLGLDSAASARLDAMSARDDAGRRQALAWRALARGELVQPEWIDGESAIGSMAMKEAQAQGNDANFLALAARQFPPTDWSIEAARGKPIRSLEYLIWPALSPSLMQQHGDAIRAQLDAIAPEMQKIPATSMPFPHGAWALTLSLLHGDVDGAMARLEVMSTLSPLVWEPLLVSPSGREMPFMQLVRAHPKFAKILANRDALIARERARIRTLRPDLK